MKGMTTSHKEPEPPKFETKPIIDEKAIKSKLYDTVYYLDRSDVRRDKPNQQFKDFILDGKKKPLDDNKQYDLDNANYG